MHFRDTRPPTRTRLVEYDSRRRRLWIVGQRCHHGATGSVIALAAAFGLIAGQVPLARGAGGTRPFAVLGLTGGALMAHDWKDRSVWFARGRGL